MEQKKAAREATFSIPGVPKQERSAVQQSKMDEELIKAFEPVSAAATSQKNKKKNKSKK